MNFLITSYAYSQGDVLPDPSINVRDANAQIHLGFLSYVRSLDVWGQSGKIALQVPFASLSASGKVEGEVKARNVAGFADPVLQLSVNLYGAPALSGPEFRAYRQDTILGVSLLVTAPFGQYDPDRVVNIGTNRWSFRPQLGVTWMPARPCSGT